jgi:hypothetical protein
VTGKEALQLFVCVVCVGQFCNGEGSVKPSDLEANEHLLPTRSHPFHILTNEMLLYLSVLSPGTNADGISIMNVCMNCMSYLRCLLSLTNEMWIGPVPLKGKYSLCLNTF